MTSKISLFNCLPSWTNVHCFGLDNIVGLATPSEAAGLGALGAIFLAYSRNNLTRKSSDESVYDSIKLTSMVFMILIGATNVLTCIQRSRRRRVHS